ncbi:MAG: glycosyltransferase, partial [bacterium]
MLKENEEKYLVSAIVSTYNAERFIFGRIQNLLEQTLYKKHQLEIIVIDTASPQNEKSIIGVFRMRYENITYMRTEERESLYAAWNKGVQLSKAKFVINANTCDRFAHDALERMAKKLLENHNIHAVYGNWLYTKIENDTFDSDTEKLLYHYPEFFPPLFFYDQITSPAPLLRRSVFKKIGFYDEGCTGCGDKDFMLRFSVYGLKAQKIDSTVGLYLDSPESIEQSEKIASEVESTFLSERFLAPEYFIRLFGKNTLPENTTLAQLYADIGSMGKDIFSLDGKPLGQAVLAERLLYKALDFDKSNIMALNNCAIIKCMTGEQKRGIELFEQALKISEEKEKQVIDDNLSVAKDGSSLFSDYYWLKPESMDYRLGIYEQDDSEQSPLAEEPPDSLSEPIIDTTTGTKQESLNEQVSGNEQDAVQEESKENLPDIIFKDVIKDEELAEIEEMEMSVLHDMEKESQTTKEQTLEELKNVEQINKEGIKKEKAVEPQNIKTPVSKKETILEDHLAEILSDVEMTEQEETSDQPQQINVPAGKDEIIPEDDTANFIHEGEMIEIEETSDQPQQIKAPAGEDEIIPEDDTANFIHDMEMIEIEETSDQPQQINVPAGEDEIIPEDDIANFIHEGEMIEIEETSDQPQQINIPSGEDEMMLEDDIANFIHDMEMTEIEEISDEPQDRKASANEENISTEHGRSDTIKVGKTTEIEEVSDEPQQIRMPASEEKTVLEDHLAEILHDVEMTEIEEASDDSENIMAAVNKQEMIVETDRAQTIPETKMTGIEEGRSKKDFKDNERTEKKELEAEKVPDNAEKSMHEREVSSILTGDDLAELEAIDRIESYGDIQELEQVFNREEVIENKLVTEEMADRIEQQEEAIEIISDEELTEKREEIELLEFDEKDIPGDTNAQNNDNTMRDDAKSFHEEVRKRESEYHNTQKYIDKLVDSAQAGLRQAGFEAESPEEMYEKIQLLVNNGKFKEAIESLEKLIALYPGSALAHNDLGVLYFDQGDKQKSLAHYQAAIGLQPHNSIFKKNLADFYFVEMGRIEDALKIYTEVLRENPKDSETLFNLGTICKALQKFDDAKFFYNKVLFIDPGNANARKNLADLQDRGEKDSTLDFADEYLISAIVSTYNAEGFIRGCIEDLEEQTIADRLEIIIINSGSEQNEEAIVKELQQRYKNIVYIKTKERENLYTAWNRGIKAARGKYITNANTDDRHAKDAFKRMTDILEENPTIALVYAGLHITKTENETFDNCTKIGSYNWYDWDRNILLDKGCFIGPQPIWRKKVHDLYGYFDESFIVSGDYEFWLRISQTADFYYLKMPLGLYLQSPSSIEHTNKNLKISEIRKIISLYRAAADKGIILNCRPIDQLQALLGNGTGKDKEKVRQLIHEIEELIQLEKNEDSLTQLKMDILEGDCIDEPIERFIKTASCSILKNTSWWPARNSKLVSIIINSLGQDNYNRKCMESIKRYTREPYELFFVNDNNTISCQNPKEGIKTDIVKTCNEGIRNSSGNYIVLLEGDTIVTDGWLSGMLECLERTSGTGIVGPMANHVKGVQRVKGAAYSSIASLSKYSKSFRERNHNRRIPSVSIDPFCMLFKRDLVEKIGLMDENLGLGGFEYEDFCIRAAMEGYRNMIAADVFIHHYGHKSPFENKKKFTEKWSNIDAQSPLGKKTLTLNVLRNASEFNQKGQINDAVDLLFTGIKHCPNDKSIYYKLVEILLESKQFKDASDIIDKMPSDDQDVKKLELIGYCKEGLGLYEEAAECAAQILKINPSSAVALNLKGMVAYKQGRKNEAEDFFTRAIKLDPGYGEPYTNIGTMKWDIKQEREALNLFLKGFILSPYMTDSITICHSAVTALEEFGWAEMIFQEANALNPCNKRIKFLLIDILIRQGKFEKAMEEIQDALALFPIEEGILSAALKVRNQLETPLEIKEIAQKEHLLSLCMI